MSCYATTLFSVSYEEEDTWMSYEEEDACHVMQPRYVLCVHTACMPCMYTCMHVHDEQMYALMQACPLLSMSAHGGPDASMPPI
jgi:hypothetical protein